MKPDRPKTTWRREFLSELEERKYLFSDASTEAQSKEKWRTIVQGLFSGKKS